MSNFKEINDSNNGAFSLNAVNSYLKKAEAIMDKAPKELRPYMVTTLYIILCCVALLILSSMLSMCVGS
ncbi:MAG: hypothetical protein KKA79_03870 [Nanoarchaeota archaeon]|nr:hypothetical protein [Nanoarchaeota archaeon]